MLKKRISFLMALVMFATLMFGAVPASAKEGFVANGYTIMDSAYNDGTYVVMAKNWWDNDNHPVKIYTSRNGKDWVETLSVASAKKWGAPTSKQNILWWEKEQVFVASVGDNIYTSGSGDSWEINSVLSANINYELIDERDGVLTMVSGDTGKVQFATSLSSVGEATSITGGSQQFGSIGAGPVVDGIPSYWAMNRYQYFRNTLPDATGNWQGNRGNSSKDAKYVSSFDGWMLLLNNGKKIEVLNYKADMATINVLVNGEEISGDISAIGSDANVLVAGATDGEIYTMQAPEKRPSGDSTWSEVMPAVGTTKISEEVTDITSIGNNEFFITTETGVYNVKETATGYEYSDMLSYKEIEEARVIGSLPFDGVSIMGGAYSPELDRYVAYGNDAEGYGHIFYSDDGINWNTTDVGTTTKTHGADNKTKNVMVWWPAQEMFVLSTATQKATQTCWYSKNGISWSFINKNGFGDNGDISVMGDYLYSSYKGSNWAIRRFATINNTSTFDNIFYTIKNSNNQACTTMAVSDDAVPVVLVGSGYGQTFVNRGTLDKENVTEATLIAPGGTSASSQMRDVHWNTHVDKFVGVNSVSSSVYLISGEGTIEQFVPNTESGVLAAVDTNGSSYLTGGANGTIYYSATPNISTSSTFAEVPATGKVNTLPVTNIFVGKDGKYFVTVSDGVENDILIVNADGSGYAKASDLTVPESIEAGNTIKIAVKTANYTEANQNIRFIAAIYDSTGTKLLQVVSEDKTLNLNKNELQELEVTAAEGVSADSKLKVFIWDSLGGMVPATDAKAFF